MSEKVRREVQLMFVKGPYVSKPWYVPIEAVSDTDFRTGQNLSFDKMTGKTPLTEEEKKKYPYVINPLTIYSFPNRHKFYPEENEYDAAIVKLILMSNKIARTEVEYKANKHKYDGFFFDREAEAKVKTKSLDLAFEAEQKVRNIRLEDYVKYILLFNYKMGLSSNIPVKGQTPEYIRFRFIEEARKEPQKVLDCFSEGMEKDLFVLELIHYGVLTQNPKGDIYEGRDFLAASVDEMKRMLAKESSAGMVQRFGMQLMRAKGIEPKEEAKKTGYDKMTLEEIHKLILNPRSSYRKKDVEDSWEDKDKLIEYLTMKDNA